MAQRTLFNVWSATLGLWDSVIRKRISLQQMKLELKLNSVLNDQVSHTSITDPLFFTLHQNVMMLMFLKDLSSWDDDI